MSSFYELYSLLESVRLSCHMNMEEIRRNEANTKNVSNFTESEHNYIFIITYDNDANITEGYQIFRTRRTSF